MGNSTAKSAAKSAAKSTAKEGRFPGMRILTNIRAAAPRFPADVPLTGIPVAPDRARILAALRVAAADADVHDAVVGARAYLVRHGEDVPVRAALAALLERVQPLARA